MTTANPYRGEVDLTVELEDGAHKKYKLSFNCSNIVALEEQLGEPGTSFNWLSFKTRQAALYQALRKDAGGSRLTMAQCGDMICSADGLRISRAVMRAYFLAASGVDIEKKLAELESEGGADPLDSIPAALLESSPAAANTTGINSVS